jgi:hypothetical protein
MKSGMGEIEAACSGGGAGAAIRIQRGCALARSNVGIYTVTLDRALNLADGVFVASPANNAAGNSNVQVVHTSDTVKTVNAFVAAVATDMEFCFMAMRAGASNGPT